MSYRHSDLDSETFGKWIEQNFSNENKILKKCDDSSTFWKLVVNFEMNFLCCLDAAERLLLQDFCWRTLSVFKSTFICFFYNRFKHLWSALTNCRLFLGSLTESLFPKVPEVLFFFWFATSFEMFDSLSCKFTSNLWMSLFSWLFNWFVSNLFSVLFCSKSLMIS